MMIPASKLCILVHRTFMSYTKFVIVSHLRSGTHLLRSLLDSHPGIVCQTEVYNSDSQSLPYPLSTPTREILDQWVFRKLPAEIRCVGFVLQAYHPRGLKAFPGIRENSEWSDIWSILRDIHDLRIIHLERENLLRRHLSHVMAQRTGRWHDWDPDRLAILTHLGQPFAKRPGRPPRPAVTLEFDRLRLDFEEVEQLHKRVAVQFGDRTYHRVSYEQLCADPEYRLAQILEFLSIGGPGDFPLQAAVSKLENRPLETSIENYDELRKAFSGTRWQVFFDDA